MGGIRRRDFAVALLAVAPSLVAILAVFAVLVLDAKEISRGIPNRFYEVTAQIIPVFVLAVAVEARANAVWFRTRTVGGWARSQMLVMLLLGEAAALTALILHFPPDWLLAPIAGALVGSFMAITTAAVAGPRLEARSPSAKFSRLVRKLDDASGTGRDPSRIRAAFGLLLVLPTVLALIVITWYVLLEPLRVDTPEELGEVARLQAGDTHKGTPYKLEAIDSETGLCIVLRVPTWKARDASACELKIGVRGFYGLEFRQTTSHERILVVVAEPTWSSVRLRLYGERAWREANLRSHAALQRFGYTVGFAVLTYSGLIADIELVRPSGKSTGLLRCETGVVTEFDLEATPLETERSGPARCEA